MEPKTIKENNLRREERVRKLKNWLQLSFLRDHVHVQLQQLLLSKLEKLCGYKWDGSRQSILLLQKTLGKARRRAPRTLQERIENGDVVNWDLQAVSYVLQALGHAWVSPDEKNQIEVAVKVRNFLAHHPNKIICDGEFSKQWDALFGVLKFFNAPTDLIRSEIKAQTADLTSLYSPSVKNREANKLKKEGNDAFKSANYDKAVEKYAEAMQIITLKDSDRGVLFSNRSAALLQLAKGASDEERRKHYATRAKNDAKMAVDLHPMWNKALFRLADACEVLEKYDKALEAYNEALTLDPSSKDIKTRRNECRDKLAQRHQASDHLPPMKTCLLSVEGWTNTSVSKEKVAEQGMENKIDACCKIKDALGTEDVYRGIQHRDGLETPVNYEQAAKYFSKAAVEGNAQATYELAVLTQSGKGVVKDQRLALKLYEKASEMAPDSSFGPNVGVREAMHALGFLHHKGVCVNKSDKKAFEWYKRAADLGHGPSANNLGIMYSKGEGGAPSADQEKAVQYWKLAAGKKCTRAMRFLAHFYCQQRDAKKARDWMELAIKSGEVLTVAEQEEFEQSCIQEQLSEIPVQESKLGQPSKKDEVLEDSTKSYSVRPQPQSEQIPYKLGSTHSQTMDKQVGEIRNWLQLTFLGDRVNAELQSLLLSKLEKICGCEWDGSPEHVSLLKLTMGEKELKFAGKATKERIDKGDVCNWDLTSVSFVLRSLSEEWVSLDEKQQMEAAVEVRNFLNHHSNRIIPDGEFLEKRNVLLGVLKFVKAPVDLIEKEIRDRTADAAALYSPSVLNQEANKLKEEGNQAFRNGNYDKAVEKYDEAIRIITLKDSERGVLFLNRSATFLEIAKLTQDDQERQRYAKQAEVDAKRAAHLHPSWPKALQRLGDAYQSLEKYEKAVEAYNEALGLDPSSEVLRVRRDDCRIKLGKRKRKDHLDPLSMRPTSKEETAKQMNSIWRSQSWTPETMDNLMGMARERGDPMGFANVYDGMHHLDGLGTPVNYELAAKYFSEAAAKGNAQATYELAVLTRDGKGVRKDPKLALELLFKAAAMPPDFPFGPNTGVREAMHCIGLMYDEGVCVDKSDSKAFEWYKRAADLGLGFSANNLANMYMDGRGGISCADPEKAVQYWKVAARDKNTRAMESLAVHFLLEGDVKQARDWMKFAIEGGDLESLAMKENFEKACLRVEEKMRPLKAELESELGRPLEETDSIQDLLKAFFPNEYPELVIIKDKLDSIRRRAAAASPHQRTHVRDYNPVVVAQYAAQGRVYAQQILKALEHFVAAMDHLLLYKASHRVVDAEALISELGQWIETAHFVAGLTEAKKDFIKKLVQEKMGVYSNKSCQLDIYARECYAYLIMGSFQENVVFLKTCIAKYPKVPYFHDCLASMHGFLKQHSQGLEVAEKALVTFPDECELLYCKAGLAKLAYEETKRDPDQEIENYKKFLQHAPADHRKVPQAYYSIAELLVIKKGLSTNYSRDLEEVKVYFEKGIRSEKLLLPCFLPYDSTVKDIINLMLGLLEDSLKPKPPPQQRNFSLDTNTAAQDNLSKSRLNDPSRVAAILHHRQNLSVCCHMMRTYSTLVGITAQPQFEQAAPSKRADLKAITLSKMNPAIDKVYENCVLDVVLIEDPNVNFTSVHVVLEDKKGEVLRGFFYNCKSNPRLKYGAKISIISPYLRIAVDNKPGIRVDDPKSLLFHDEDDTGRCRYCGGRDSKFYCIKCTRQYCSKECQTLDWKVLKHKLICGIDFVESRPVRTRFF